MIIVITIRMFEYNVDSARKLKLNTTLLWNSDLK